MDWIEVERISAKMREKILIADDEREIVEFMRDALEDEGYDVRIAYDGSRITSYNVCYTKLLRRWEAR